MAQPTNYQPAVDSLRPVEQGGIVRPITTAKSIPNNPSEQPGNPPLAVHPETVAIPEAPKSPQSPEVPVAETPPVVSSPNSTPTPPPPPTPQPTPSSEEELIQPSHIAAAKNELRPATIDPVVMSHEAVGAGERGNAQKLSAVQDQINTQNPKQP